VLKHSSANDKVINKPMALLPLLYHLFQVKMSLSLDCQNLGKLHQLDIHKQASNVLFQYQRMRVHRVQVFHLKHVVAQ
jgi:hypothetical protein